MRNVNEKKRDEKLRKGSAQSEEGRKRRRREVSGMKGKREKNKTGKE